MTTERLLDEDGDDSSLLPIALTIEPYIIKGAEFEPHVISEFMLYIAGLTVTCHNAAQPEKLTLEDILSGIENLIERVRKVYQRGSYNQLVEVELNTLLDSLNSDD